MADQYFPHLRPVCEVRIWHKTQYQGPQTPIVIATELTLADGSRDANTFSFGDNGSATTTKGLYDAAGEFTIQVPDMPIELESPPNSGTIRRDSLYGFIEPMDVIEIWMRRDTSEPLTPVMRGFIRGVGREETISEDGRPLRTVVLTGHDYGCVFSIQQIGVIKAIVDNNPAALALNKILAAKGVEGKFGLAGPLKDFVRLITGLTDEIMFETIRHRFEFDDKDAPGSDNVFIFVAPTMEGPLWSILTRFTDSPWNEVFVKENPNNPVVVTRKTPWPENNDDIVTPNKPIEMTEVISLRAHRDDSEVVNVVSLNSPLATPFNFPVNNLISHPEFLSWVNHPSSHQNVFGFRLAQMDSVLGSVAPCGENELQCTKDSKELMEFFIERAKWLKARYIPSADLERGSIEMRGRPDIQVGDFIHVKRGADAQVDWSAYVVRVTHSFRPYISYTTTIEYIRSNQYIRRSKIDRPWELERKRVNT